ncbi:hypothetical protein Q5752_002144 [Cryptotrichosporon argae]
MPSRSASRDKFGLFGTAPRARDAASRSQSRSGHVRLQLHVPAGGVMLLLNPALEAARDFSRAELAGDLEIEIPHGMGKRRCRRISVGLRSRCRLLIPGRGWEEDTIFERKVEVRGAIILHEGVQRFDFSIILPFHLGPHDWQQHGSVELSLFAEVEGLPKQTTSSWFPRSVSPRRPQPNHQPLVAPPMTAAKSNDMSAPDIDAIAHDMTVSWQDPVVALDGEEKVEWLHGTKKTERDISLAYNPNLDNEVNTLDLSTSAAAAGLVVGVRWTSEIFTVSAPLTTDATIECEPEVTVYTVRVVITQTTHIRSPRDDPASAPHEHTRRFVVYTAGYVPDEGRVVKKDAPVLFKGSDGPYELHDTSLLPADDKLRPSTLAGVLTPIRVSHSLVLEVWFSNGTMVNGAQELKIMRVQKAVEVPSCLIIPSMLELPTYDDPTASNTDPCPLCHLPPSEQLCRTCQTTIPHARHDLDPELVGDARGVCRLCSERLIPGGRSRDQKGCACELRDEEGVKAREMSRRPRLRPVDSGSNSEVDLAALKLQEEERGRRR